MVAFGTQLFHQICAGVTSGTSSDNWLNCGERPSRESLQKGFPVLPLLSEAERSPAAIGEKLDKIVCDSGVLKVDTTVFDLGVQSFLPLSSEVDDKISELAVDVLCFLFRLYFSAGYESDTHTSRLACPEKQYTFRTYISLFSPSSRLVSYLPPSFPSS